MKQRFAVLLFLATLLPLFASAQTTQPYFANSGSVSSFNAVKGYPLTANLPGGSTVSGGDFNSPYGMGGQCYWGGCPNWPFYNYPLSYVLPMDNSTASFTNFTGTADFSSTHCSVSPQCIFAKGTASGVDSLGRSVSLSIRWEVAAYCRSGRGGGCTKKARSGRDGRNNELNHRRGSVAITVPASPHTNETPGALLEGHRGPAAWFL